MAKKGIHPATHKLLVKIGNDSFVTNSSSNLGELVMDVDFRRHPAWDKSNTGIVNQSNEKVAKFNKKFDMDFLFSGDGNK